MIKPGDTVYINGKPYVLGEKIGGGIQGNVFNVVDYPKHVIKVINESSLSRDEILSIRKRLEWLKNDIGNTDLKQKLSLPKGLLDHNLGYVMVKADNHDNLNHYFSIKTDDINDWIINNYKLRKRYQIIVSIFQALREIHLSGLIFTDLSPSNILVHKDKNQMVFIDTDNLRNRKDKYISVLGTPGYMAPEIYHSVDQSLISKSGINSSIFSKSGAISIDSDIFSAAIIAFQLITLQHPFIGDEIENGPADFEDKAMMCETDFIFKENTANTSTVHLTPYYNLLTTEHVRELFSRTFVNGKTSPKDRPTDHEFLEGFQKALDLIVSCPHCGFENIENMHVPYNCSFCNQIIQPHPTLSVLLDFKEQNIATLINGIAQMNILDKSEYTNQDYKKEISRIVLENDKVKSLYLRHFEENVNRSQVFAQVKVINNEEVEFNVSREHFKHPQLINKKNNTRIPLDKGKRFLINDYDILLDSKLSSASNFNIIVSFIK